MVSTFSWDLNGPKRKQNNAYAKFAGKKKEYYGIFRNGQLFSSFRPLIKYAKTHSTVECLAVKIIQSESRRFLRGKVCRLQRVFLVVNIFASENEII